MDRKLRELERQLEADPNNYEIERKILVEKLRTGSPSPKSFLDIPKNVFEISKAKIIKYKEYQGATGLPNPRVWIFKGDLEDIWVYWGPLAGWRTSKRPYLIVPNKSFDLGMIPLEAGTSFEVTTTIGSFKSNPMFLTAFLIEKAEDPIC